MASKLHSHFQSRFLETIPIIRFRPYFKPKRVTKTILFAVANNYIAHIGEYFPAPKHFSSLDK